jgi:hypothetical protein
MTSFIFLSNDVVGGMGVAGKAYCGRLGEQSTRTKTPATLAKHGVGLPFERSALGTPLPKVSSAAPVEAGCMPLDGLSAASGFKTVAEPFGLDLNEPEPAAGAAAARPAELFLARRTQALSSAHARFVSGE